MVRLKPDQPDWRCTTD